MKFSSEAYTRYFSQLSRVLDNGGDIDSEFYKALTEFTGNRREISSPEQVQDILNIAVDYLKFSRMWRKSERTYSTSEVSDILLGVALGERSLKKIDDLAKRYKGDIKRKEETERKRRSLGTDIKRRSIWVR